MPNFLVKPGAQSRNQLGGTWGHGHGATCHDHVFSIGNSNTKYIFSTKFGRYNHWWINVSLTKITSSQTLPLKESYKYNPIVVGKQYIIGFGQDASEDVASTCNGSTQWVAVVYKRVFEVCYISYIW